MIFEAIWKWIRSGGNGAGAAGSGPPADQIPCKEALSRLYELLDGELDDLTREQVEAHVEVCRLCYPHLAGERAFRVALRRALEGRRAPEDLRHRILETLEGASDQR